MKNTSTIGNITEAVILAHLTKKGKSVLLPFGGGLPYDLVIDDNGLFLKVQCKTGKLRDGVIEFRNHTTLRSGGSRNYNGCCDYFAIFCPQNEKVYLIKVEDCGITPKCIRLRVSPTKNGMKKFVRWSKDYEI